MKRFAIDGELIRLFGQAPLLNFDRAGDRVFALTRGSDKKVRVIVINTGDMSLQHGIELDKKGRRLGNWLSLANGDRLVGYNRISQEFAYVDTVNGAVLEHPELPREARGADTQLFAIEGQPWFLATYTYLSKVNERDPRTLKLEERDRMDGAVISIADGSTIWEGRLAFEPTFPVLYEDGFLLAGRRNYGTSGSREMYLRKVDATGVSVLADTNTMLEPGGLVMLDESRALIAGRDGAVIVDLATGDIKAEAEFDFRSDGVVINKNQDMAFISADYGSKVAMLNPVNLTLHGTSTTGRTGVKIGQVLASVAGVALAAYTGFGYTYTYTTDTLMHQDPGGDAIYVFNTRTQDMTAFDLPEFERTDSYAASGPYIPFVVDGGDRFWMIGGDHLTPFRNGAPIQDETLTDAVLAGAALDQERVFYWTEQEQLLEVDLRSASRKSLMESERAAFAMPLNSLPVTDSPLIYANFPRQR